MPPLKLSGNFMMIYDGAGWERVTVSHFTNCHLALWQISQGMHLCDALAKGNWYLGWLWLDLIQQTKKLYVDIF